MRRPSRDGTTLRWRVERYAAAHHGLDVLVYVYMQAAEAGEAVRYFQRAGPLAFVKDYASGLVFVGYEAGRAWRQGEGLIGLAWADEIVEGCRAFLHVWVAPPYRQPRLLDAIVEKVLESLYTTYQFRVVLGLIPLTNKVACLTARRWGFRQVALLPDAALDTVPDPHTLTPVPAALFVQTAAEFRAHWGCQSVPALHTEEVSSGG